jgi:hypothetical protein
MGCHIDSFQIVRMPGTYPHPLGTFLRAADRRRATPPSSCTGIPALPLLIMNIPKTHRHDGYEELMDEQTLVQALSQRQLLLVLW